MKDEKDDYDEEEFIVYADFGSHLTSSEISDDNLDIKIIGIDADHPIIEANGKIFKGTYNFSLGTQVLFDKNENPPPTDPLYDKQPDEIYKCLAKTNKILELKRIFLETDNSQENIDNNKQDDESVEELKSRLEVTTTYLEALNMLLPRGSNLKDEYLKRRLTNCEDDEEPNNSTNEDPDYIPENDEAIN